MSTLICSFDGLHDNRVLRYYADFEAHILHMDTQTEAGEKVSVHFTGLLAHWFENVIQDNILFGMDEITVDVDDDPRAVYFQQARFGMYARMALLEHLATQPRIEDRDLPPVEIGTKPVCTNPRCITQTQHYLPPLVKKIGGVDCCGFCDAALR